MFRIKTDTDIPVSRIVVVSIGATSPNGTPASLLLGAKITEFKRTQGAVTIVVDFLNKEFGSPGRVTDIYSAPTLYSNIIEPQCLK